MHAVLDGEATPAEASELERHLACTPAARAEFEDLKRLFQDLAAVPQRHPPVDLIGAVQGALEAMPRSGQAADQLSAAARVLGSSSGGIHVRREHPATHHQQEPLSHRRVPMTQPHPPYSAKRKTLIGAGIALVAVVIVVQFGFDSTPRSEDVAGTVVPAQRYRAAQGGAADIKLGDQNLAQLMQNDAFVRLVRDPQIQAMAREPGFLAAMKVMEQNPDLARFLAGNADLAGRVMATPEAANALAANAQAAQAVAVSAEAAAMLRSSQEAQRLLAENHELARYVRYMADLNKVAVFKHSMDSTEAARLLAENAEQAQRFAERATAAEKMMASHELARLAAGNAQLERFMNANADAMKVAKSYADVSRSIAANTEIARLFAMNFEAARFFAFNADAARVVAQNPDAARVLAANPEAAKVMLASPEASRHIMMNADAARSVLHSFEAERLAR
jgi:hypothetical protein